MEKASFSDLLKKEQENIEYMKSENSEFFEREVQIDDDETLRKIGIAGLPKKRPVGYIKLWPQDFVVEETSQDKTLRTVSPKSEEYIEEDLEGKTIYADLVKVGVSTIDARDEFSKALGIEEKYIGTAGIKDKDALTSQRISFRNIDKEAIQQLSFPHFFLKNISQGKGVVDIGMLYGNRFTIIVRTKEEVEKEKLDKFLEGVSKHGFLNFYYLQRFGTPRLLTHIWGLYILRGEYEKAVRIMFTRPGEREIPFFVELRRQIDEHWGNWDRIWEILDFFPLSFRNEILMVEWLREHSDDFLGALRTIPQQVQFGIYAYSSFLFNSLLSTLLQKGIEPPKELPLFLSRNQEHQDLYSTFFEKHGLRMPSPAFHDFPHVQWAGHSISTRSHADIHGYKILPKSVIIDFSLQKGSYATSFLSNFFTLSSGMPVVDSIPLDRVDSFSELGKGSLLDATDRFKEVIVSKIDEDESEDRE